MDNKLHHMEKPEDVYAELEKNFSGKKSLTSLINIKAAIDTIELSGGIVNFSKVARVAKEKFGGPANSTIQNNDDLKRYINARTAKDSSTKSSNKNLGSTSNGSINTISSYPASDLDPKTRAAFDQLTRTIKMYEERHKSQSKQIEELTKANPVNLANAIAKGPEGDGASLAIEYQQHDSQEHQALREGVKSLLDLVNVVDNLELEHRDDKTMMILRRPMGDLTVLNPHKFKMLSQMASAGDNAGGLV